MRDSSGPFIPEWLRVAGSITLVILGIAAEGFLYFAGDQLADAVRGTIQTVVVAVVVVAVLAALISIAARTSR